MATGTPMAASKPALNFPGTWATLTPRARANCPLRRSHRGARVASAADRYTTVTNPMARMGPRPTDALVSSASVVRTPVATSRPALGRSKKPTNE